MDHCVSTQSQALVDRDMPSRTQDAIDMQDLESQLVKALTSRSEGSQMITAGDIARVCGFTERHVLNLHKRGDMPPGRRFGRVWRWHVRLVARWLLVGMEDGARSRDAVPRSGRASLADAGGENKRPTTAPPRPRPGARSTY